MLIFKVSYLKFNTVPKTNHVALSIGALHSNMVRTRRATDRQPRDPEPEPDLAAQVADLRGQLAAQVEV